MAYQEVKRYTRSVGNEARPAFPSVVTVGDTIRVGRLQKARGFLAKYREPGYKAKVTDVYWGTLPESSIWQWIVVEGHIPDTKKKDGTRLKAPRRRIKSVHGMGQTKIELKVKNKTNGVLEMYGPEQPPFLKGDNVRTSYKHQLDSQSSVQFWVPGVVQKVDNTNTSPSLDASYSFDIDEPFRGQSKINRGVTGAWYNMQSGSSLRHKA